MTAATPDRCPYCGELNLSHVYASPTSCVLGNGRQQRTIKHEDEASAATPSERRT